MDRPFEGEAHGATASEPLSPSVVPGRVVAKVVCDLFLSKSV